MVFTKVVAIILEFLNHRAIRSPKTVMIIITAVLTYQNFGVNENSFQAEILVSKNQMKLEDTWILKKIVMLHHYNFFPPPDQLQTVTSLWRTLFKKIYLAIPNSDTSKMTELSNLYADDDDINILFHPGDGNLAPMKNLETAYHNEIDSDYLGVMYFHDDLLINISSILKHEKWYNGIVDNGLCHRQSACFSFDGNGPRYNFTLEEGPYERPREIWRENVTDQDLLKRIDNYSWMWWASSGLSLVHLFSSLSSI